MKLLRIFPRAHSTCSFISGSGIQRGGSNVSFPTNMNHFAERLPANLVPVFFRKYRMVKPVEIMVPAVLVAASGANGLTAQLEASSVPGKQHDP